MIKVKKIKAGALQFVLFVGAIVAVLLMSFVLVSYTQVLFKKKTDVTIDLIQAAQTGLERSFKKPMQDGGEISFPIKKETEVEVRVEKKYWGLLEMRKVVSNKGQLEFSKIGLVGKTIEDRPVLFLKDNQRPMVIAGNARINGNAYLPQRGIKRGNIRGRGYSGSQMVYGQMLKSTSTLPGLHKEIEAGLEEFTQPFFEPKGDEVRLQNGMVAQQSFKEGSKIIKGDYLVLDNVALSGNLVVWASQKIVVHASSRLRDVILLAPHIEIRNGVMGNFQAIASKEIKVGTACTLDYPTVLAVNQPNNFGINQTEKGPPNLIVDELAVVKGTVIFKTQNELDRSSAHVHISEKATVVGEVYCDGNLELKGSVWGGTTTNAFLALENGSAYQNHLFNGTMDKDALPIEYSGMLYQGESPTSIIKWLY